MMTVERIKAVGAEEIVEAETIIATAAGAARKAVLSEAAQAEA
jgi:hypothetical protein